jgi:bifunctional UDP-N-acetylglucosamine pyrophosphorylase/glucosamine-1-phosphate N-acetyltransferase
MNITAVILAAGKGTRMRSTIPKVLHSLVGKPIVWYSIEATRQITGHKPVLVIGHGAQDVRHVVGEAADYATQEPQLGTGHALTQVEPILRGKSDFILVLTADMPLLTLATLSQVVQTHISSQAAGDPAPITMLTLLSDDPSDFGRVLRDRNGKVQAIVEEECATPEQLRCNELNMGVYCFSADWLWETLARIPLSPKGEYYLTDLVGIAVSDGRAVESVSIRDASQAIGINNRVQLAEAEAVMRRRINENWMLAGVTLIDPGNTYIESDVVIGEDTVIWPNTYLHGSTRVGKDCVLGPNSILRDTLIGDHCRVLASVADKAILEDEVQIGPFARLRKGAHLGRGVHMGNFGEVKNSYLGSGTKMGHFSYLGDTTTGPGVNIGAGTITCNYDGVKKYPTEIGADAFIGSDTMLVAPVKVGEGSATGAGAVVTKDVPPHTLAVGMPARAIRKIVKRD